jgi:hypothetical protein
VLDSCRKIENRDSWEGGASCSVESCFVLVLMASLRTTVLVSEVLSGSWGGD